MFLLPGDAARVAKVYLKPGGAQQGEKLAAMLALAGPGLKAMTAWPSALLFDAGTRAVAGFVMPRVSNGHPVQQLYNPVMRLKAFPRAGWAFHVATARNLAAAFDEVHKAGCLVGDVNQSNALVLPDTRVALIDCDSFQVRADGNSYPCDVGTPHYTPPELQGAPLRGLVRTENHDRFGLAVLIYQLLFVGRHPYAGVYTGSGDPSFEELIAGFQFAQGPDAHRWNMAPPPHTPTFAEIPPELRTLFRRAFERGSERDARPRASEWLPALSALQQSVAACTADPGHQYWSGAGGCVWCRLAAKGGPEYFFGVSGTGGTFAVDEEKLRDVLERLGRARPAEFRYDRDRFAPAAAPAPAPLPENLNEHRTMTLAVGAAAGFCAAAVPLGLIRGFIGAIAFTGALVFGVWLAVLFGYSPWQQEYRRRRRIHDRARDDLEDLETEWDHRVRAYQRDHADQSRRVRRLVAECRDLAPQYQEELRRLTANAEDAARRRHLQFHLLADADIAKIGASRKQALASAGIVTAADVERERVRAIKGFGETLTNNVVAWRDAVLRAFRFDPQTAMSPAEQQALTVRYRARQQQLLADATGTLGALAGLAPACQEALKKLIPELTRAAQRHAQAKADLRAMRPTR